MNLKLLIKCSIALLLGLFLIACKAQNMSIYNEDQINDVSIKQVSDELFELQIAPMLEAAFYLPGILIKEENEILVQFVRCKTGATCAVDASAEHDPSNPGMYKVIFSNSNKPIKINYASGTKDLWVPDS